MIRTVPSETLAHANKVALRYRLSDISLEECACKKLKSPDLATKEDFHLRTRDSATFELAPDESSLACHVSFEIHSGKENEKDASLFSLTAHYLLMYDRMVEERLEAADFAAFAELNAVHNAWPYMREFANSLTTRLGLPGLVMAPLVIVPEQSRKATVPPKSAK